jgi:hypothetical protein
MLTMRCASATCAVNVDRAAEPTASLRAGLLTIYIFALAVMRQAQRAADLVQATIAARSTIVAASTMKRVAQRSRSPG